MSVTHYDPYLGRSDSSEDCCEQAVCGTLVGEKYECTGNWKYVNCKKCLRNRMKIDNAMVIEEAFIVNQMGEMADFFETIRKEERVQG